MNDNVKNNSHELPREAWEEAAQRVMQVAGVVANSFMKVNKDGRGKEDAEAFMADIQLAMLAMTYVAQYARDKCRIITVPDDEVMS